MSNIGKQISLAVLEGVAIGLEYSLFQVDTFSAVSARANIKEFLTKKQNEMEKIRNEDTDSVSVPVAIEG